MSKATSRWLYILAIVIAIAATVLLVLGLQGSQTSTQTVNGVSQTTLTALGNPTLFGAGIVLYVVSGILAAIAWIGALVKTARLGRWGWFVCLLLLSGITMLIYIFGGPTTPANAANGQLAYQQYPPQNPQYPQYPQSTQYPPQNPQYPQQGQYPQYPPQNPPYPQQ